MSDLLSITEILATTPSVAGELPKGRDVRDHAPGFWAVSDKRTTMPRGRYAFGASDPRLRPSVPKGE